MGLIASANVRSWCNTLMRVITSAAATSLVSVRIVALKWWHLQCLYNICICFCTPGLFLIIWARYKRNIVILSTLDCTRCGSVHYVIQEHLHYVIQEKCWIIEVVFEWKQTQMYICTTWFIRWSALLDVQVGTERYWMEKHWSFIQSQQRDEISENCS